ncbi:MAG: ATP-binding protein, partial [Candidatus Gastranaerophilales bacterium]|nr:ATP-binding protein [Candidatus Gastranaerophilales bacterium]
LYVKVKDSGIGIEKKYQKIIFDKFIQLDNPYTKQVSSTGLGLTITKELLKMQNAEIKVKSELKKGSEFTAVFKIKESN